MAEQPSPETDKLVTNHKWSVVLFPATNTVSLIPNNWIKEVGGKVHYYWPEGDKEISRKIKRHQTPDISWDFPEINIIKVFDKYDEAKQAEKRLENESTDVEQEKPLGRGHRARKKKNDSSYFQDLSPPPQLPRLSEESLAKCEDDASPTAHHSASTSASASTITLSSLSSRASESQIFGAIMEVKEIVKEIKQCLQNKDQKIAVTTFETIPKEPFKKFHKVMKYEQELESDEVHQKQLETMLFLLGGSSILDMIKRGLKRLFSNKLATKCSWLGRNHNYPIYNLIIIKMLKTAVRKRYPDLSDFFFEDTVKLWFRQAGLRYSRECAKTANTQD